MEQEKYECISLSLYNEYLVDTTNNDEMLTYFCEHTHTHTKCVPLTPEEYAEYVAWRLRK